jgi:hypothetical protein
MRRLFDLATGILEACLKQMSQPIRVGALAPCFIHRKCVVVAIGIVGSCLN